jgi:hypothetical protein
LKFKQNCKNEANIFIKTDQLQNLQIKSFGSYFTGIVTPLCPDFTAEKSGKAVNKNILFKKYKKYRVSPDLSIFCHGLSRMVIMPVMKCS